MVPLQEKVSAVTHPMHFPVILMSGTLQTTKKMPKLQFDISGMLLHVSYMYMCIC